MGFEGNAIAGETAEPVAAAPSRGVAVFLCALPALYCLAIAAYALLNFAEYGADLPRFLRYVAAPLLIAGLFMFCALRMPPRRGAQFGLVASAGLVALFLVELVLSARFLMTMFGMFAVLSGDNGNSAEIARGRDGIPPMYASKQVSILLDVERLDEAVLGGVPHAEVLLCARDGEPLFYTADRFGFNNDDAVYDAPLEVAVVGDSFVEGHCQPRPDTLVGRIRAIRPQTASMGMRAGGPLLGLAFIGRYASELEPDYVVMAFFEGNDWQNLRREAATPWLREALDPDADFGSSRLSDERLAQVDDIIEAWWDQDYSQSDILTRTSTLRNIMALNNVWGLLGLDYPRVSRAQPVYGDVLARAQELTASWDGEFALLYIPQVARYRGLFDKSFVYDQLRDQVLEAAAAQGIPVIDLAEEFGRVGDPASLYAVDGHFNARGSQLAAEAVDRWIRTVEDNGDPSPREGAPARERSGGDRPDFRP